jgi:hypothetical protein
MAETKLVVEHREHLWNLLIQASQVEHLIMCQYLYASFSLKTGPDEALPLSKPARSRAGTRCSPESPSRRCCTLRWSRT